MIDQPPPVRFDKEEDLPPEMKAALEAARKTAAAAPAAASPPPPARETGANSLGGEPGERATLSVDELQTLREMIARESNRPPEKYRVPEKEVTEEDRQRFYDSVGERRPFSEEAVIIEGKLEVVFRCKTRREREIIERQLTNDLSKGLIKNDIHYSAAATNYNLMMQMVSLNGVTCAHPSTVAMDDNFDLRRHILSHVINTMPEPMIFMLSGALTQFEMRVDKIEKECLERSFMRPAGP